MTGFALMLSYIEAIVPLGLLPLPGCKPGLANVVSLITLYSFGFFPALLTVTARCLLSALLFGGLTGFLFSFSGALLALISMAALKKTGLFSMFSVSVTGATAHNLCQVAVACLMLGSMSVISYLPVLMLWSLVFGCVTAVLAVAVMSKVKPDNIR